MKKSLYFLFVYSTPSSCGHSPYFIYNEQRESVDTLMRFLCYGYLFNPSVTSVTPPLYFAMQNTEEEGNTFLYIVFVLLPLLLGDTP